MIQRGIRIPAKDWDALEKHAKRLSKQTPGTVTPSDLIREAVRRYLRRIETD